MSYFVRHTEPGDAPALHAILTSPHVVDGSMRLPFAPLSATERRLAPRDGVYHLSAFEAENLAGWSEFVTHPDAPRHAHVGEVSMIAVRADCQRRGVGRALVAAMLRLADDWLQLERVELSVWTHNEAAIHLYRSVGFEVEGTLRKYAKWQGRFADALIMSRLRNSGVR